MRVKDLDVCAGRNTIKEHLTQVESDEDFQLFLIANERSKTHNDNIDFDIILKEFNITHEELDMIECDVIIE